MKVATTDVKVAAIDEMEPIHGGLARRARATLGVSAWGMQVLTLPPDWRRRSSQGTSGSSSRQG